MMGLLLFMVVSLFGYCISNSFVLSDGELRIISSSDSCNIGIIEMNDYLKGWIPLTSITSDCDTRFIYSSSFDSNIGDIICKQLGFNKLNSYQYIENNNIGTNLINFLLFIFFCDFANIIVVI